MFKAQALRRSFSVFNRVPTSRIVQSAARHGHESIVVHRVRIRKPLLSRQRLVGAVAVTTAAYGLAQFLGLEVAIEEQEVHDERKPGRWQKQVRKPDGTLEDVDDTDANQLEDDEHADDDEEEYDDAILFLPTGLSRLKPTTFYKGSDPEWQEFKKISKDEARVRRIRQELVNQVRTTFSGPEFERKIGKVDRKKGRAWIDIKFPHSPPPEYERPGYELTEDLEWRKTTRDVEEAHHYKINRLLYPKSAADALYQDTKRKAVRSWNNLTAYMGWAEKTAAPTVQQMMQQVDNATPPASPVVPSAVAGPPSPCSAALPGATQQSAGQPSPPKDIADTALLDAKALTLDLGQFRQGFRAANYKNNRRLNIPRGALSVHALIEVCGSKARISLNVIAIYDPKTGKYVDMHCDLWNQMQNQQWPRGGP